MEIKQSTPKNKKYMVLVNGKWIHFGDSRYEQFRESDSTPLKLYSKDKERRRNYLQRAKRIKNKFGALAYLDKNSPNYWSIKYLW